MVVITQQKVDQGTKVIGMQYFRRDSDELSHRHDRAGSDKGNGYLRVADNFWMYRRNTRTFQHISRDESIGGTDAHGEDFEDRKLTELYQPLTDASGRRSSSARKNLGRYRFINSKSKPRSTMWITRRKSTGCARTTN